MIVGKYIIRIAGCYDFKGINGIIIIAHLLIGKAKVIVNGRVTGRNILCFMKDINRIFIAFEAAENCTKAHHCVGVIRIKGDYLFIIRNRLFILSGTNVDASQLLQIFHVGLVATQELLIEAGRGRPVVSSNCILSLC